MLSCSIWFSEFVDGWWSWERLSRTAPFAPYTRPTQRLSRPPSIHKLGKTICCNSTSNAPDDGHFLMFAPAAFRIYTLQLSVTREHYYQTKFNVQNITVLHPLNSSTLFGFKRISHHNQLAFWVDIQTSFAV